MLPHSPMHSVGAARWVWSGTSSLAHLARGALAPVEAVYGGAVAIRDALYDAEILRARVPVLPAISVGNVSVGGTGKTPFAAWLASRLALRGGSPAIVLRGYRGDEQLVHAALQPEIPVVAAPDRLLGVARAAELGADVAVLDDAFQHRRIQRVVDLVLVSADLWGPRRRLRLLPAGPWREPLTALRRASTVVVTRKAASAQCASEVAADLGRTAPGVPLVITHFALAELRAAEGTCTLPLAALAGARVLAISAIGDPHTFLEQLATICVEVTPATFGDHHRFTPADAQRLAAAAERCGHTVCTLKDAVKLGPLWPRQAPRLWYVSQRLSIEHGEDSIDALVAAVLAARRAQP